jgi:hypothetical protein
MGGETRNNFIILFWEHKVVFGGFFFVNGMIKVTIAKEKNFGMHTLAPTT